MKLKRMGEDLAKFQSVDCLTLEDVLGILQNIGKDIKKETGHSVEECEIRDPDTLMNLLIWMGNLYSRIYDANSSVLNSTIRLEKYKSMAERLQKEVSTHETIEPEISSLKLQVSSLEEAYATKAKAKQEYDMLLERKQYLETRLAGLESEYVNITTLREIVAENEKTVLRLDKEQNDLESRFRALQADRKNLDGRKTQISSEISVLERMIQQFQKELFEDSQKVEKLNEEKTELDEQNTAQKIRLTDLERNVQDLIESDIPNLRKKNADLELQKNRLVNEKQQKIDAIDVLEKEIWELNEETDKIEQQKREKETEKLNLTENLNATYGEISDLKVQIAELEQQLKGKSEESLTNWLEIKKNRLESQKENCAALEADIQAVQNEIELHEKNVTEKEEILKEIKCRAKEIDEELADYENELINLERRKEELRVKEDRRDMFKQIHQALIRNTSKLSDLPGIESYSVGACVDEMLKSADQILADLKQAIEIYVRATNNGLEGIK